MPIFDHDETISEARARNVRDALAEDIGRCDWTGLLVPAGERVRARVLVREAAVLCGRDWFDAVVLALDADARVEWHVEEGAAMAPGSLVCQIVGNARALLAAERPALNFLQLLSATATLTCRHVDAVAGASPNARGCAILDTRKTIPGLRLAQKYAVRVGGGMNQRLALYDGILIKENHIAAAGGVGAALKSALALDADVAIQIEVESLDQLHEALDAGATSVLLDNFTLPQMREAVAVTRRPRAARNLGRRRPRSGARDRRDRRRPHLDRPVDEGRAGGRFFDAGDRAAPDRLIGTRPES